MLFVVFGFSGIFIIALYCLVSHWFRYHREKDGSIRTLIVIGSGGHTAEMLNLVSTISHRYRPKLYVMADNDVTSEFKIKSVEKDSDPNSYQIVKIPRSRAVGQSYFTSIFTTVFSTLLSVQHVCRFKPNLVLCNGPGTCVPICCIAYLTKKLIRWRTKIVFVESICRVKTLSLSGKILLYIADSVVVQWQELNYLYPSTVYFGRLY